MYRVKTKIKHGQLYVNGNCVIVDSINDPVVKDKLVPNGDDKKASVASANVSPASNNRTD